MTLSEGASYLIIQPAGRVAPESHRPVHPELLETPLAWIGNGRTAGQDTLGNFQLELPIGTLLGSLCG